MVALDDLISNMRAEAEANPIDVVNSDAKAPNNYAFTEVCGFPVHVQLTVDLVKRIKFWHLSMSQKRQDSDSPRALPEFVVNLVKQKFLGDVGSGSEIEIPSMMYAGIVRQFMKEL